MMMVLLNTILLVVLLALALWIAFHKPDQAILIHLVETLSQKIEQLDHRFADLVHQQSEASAKLREELRAILSEHNSGFEKRQGEAVKQTLESIHTGLAHLQKLTGETLTRHSNELDKRMLTLTEQTDKRLKEISAQVEKRLAEGFEKTNATFTDILKRLAIIDEAQKRITELSSNVVSLQEVLADKRSRGAFGEVQLAALVKNVLPEEHFKLQHKLSNDKIADCVLFLPEPTGTIAIDSKFPLESYRTMTDETVGDEVRKRAGQQFKNDIRTHINDIAEKYIIAGQTSDGAVMFIPAEAIFAEIQAHHPDLVEKAHRAKVWMTSPTTLWAILNTARAVLKDAKTREQIHIIQQHLGLLAKDFERFQNRMDALAKHINQANQDVEQVHISARKISRRFNHIEQAELDTDPLLEVKENEQPNSEQEKNWTTLKK